MNSSKSNSTSLFTVAPENTSISNSSLVKSLIPYVLGPWVIGAFTFMLIFSSSFFTTISFLMSLVRCAYSILVFSVFFCLKRLIKLSCLLNSICFLSCNCLCTFWLKSSCVES
jgi:hypothetical protein